MAVYKCGDCSYMNMNDSNKYDYNDKWCGYYRKYYDPSSRACSHAVAKNNSSGSNCYITTAVCDILGYQDNCDFLQILRNFRESYMKTCLSCYQLLEEYDEIGPLISDAIWKDEKRHEVAEFMLNFGIAPACKLILIGKHDSAIEIYTNMVETLKENYGLTDIPEEKKFPVRKREF